MDGKWKSETESLFWCNIDGLQTLETEYSLCFNYKSNLEMVKQNITLTMNNEQYSQVLLIFLRKITIYQLIFFAYWGISTMRTEG